MEHNFHNLFSQIVQILRRDYAGIGQCADSFCPRYYTQAIGQGWNDGILDELLFLRYVNQMLACTGDRHLSLSLLPGEGYEPYGPGFTVRRWGDALYVTELFGEDRLAVGQRITAINGGSPAHHRQAIQKNFFYADEPGREDWGGLLKMAQSIDTDGLGTIELRHYPIRKKASEPSIRFPGTAAVIVPGCFDGQSKIGELMEQNRARLLGCERLIFDLRRCSGTAEEDFYSLLPWLFSGQKNSRELLGDIKLYVNYTKLNCALRAQALKGIPGAEDYIAELQAKAGLGFVEESDESGEIIKGIFPGRVVVLSDMYCRDAGESFLAAARRIGIPVVGRAGMGTLDYCGDVSLLLDGRYILRWPTAVTAAARQGQGLKGRGIAPDIAVPFTPEEFGRDILLETALKT